MTTQIFNGNFEVFSKENLGSVRTMVGDNGSIWFVGKDVCDILGLGTPSKAYERLLPDEQVNLKVNSTHFQDETSHGGARRVKLISESGLYSLVLGSRKPEAEAFQRWITREVLPSIRKNGGYILGQEALSDSDRAVMDAQIKALSQQITSLQKEKEEESWAANTFQKYYDDMYEQFQKILKENKELCAQIEALKNSSSVSEAPATPAKVIVPMYIYDQFGNRYATREEFLSVDRD